MTEHATDTNITKVDRYKNFYRGAQSRNEHITINIYKSSKGLINIKTPHKKG